MTYPRRPGQRRRRCLRRRRSTRSLDNIAAVQQQLVLAAAARARRFLHQRRLRRLCNVKIREKFAHKGELRSEGGRERATAALQLSLTVAAAIAAAGEW